VVAKGAVEAEIRVLVGMEQGRYGPQYSEYRRGARALFLGEYAVGLGDGKSQALLRRLGEGDILFLEQGSSDGGQKRLAPAVQGLDAHGASARGNYQRRVDDGRIPPGIATWILVIGGEHGATARIQTIYIGIERTFVGLLAALPVQRGAGRGAEAPGAAVPNFTL